MKDSKITIAQFNIENLFIFMDHYKSEDLENISERKWQALSAAKTKNKPLRKLWGVESAITDIDPDILLLNEVGGFTSLENFNYYFLKDRYNVHLIRGNSLRGIDVGVLTKKTLPLEVTLKSHSEKVIPLIYEHEKELSKPPKHRLSRDVLEVGFKKVGASKESLIILLTHLKSKLDPDRIDAFGSLRREAEANLLVKIYNSLPNKTTPVIVAGDFNGHAGSKETEHEFLSIHDKSNLTDCFDLTHFTIKERMTHLQILHGGNKRFLQIDYMFLNPLLKEFVDSKDIYVYRYKTEEAEQPLPKNLTQRLQLPSDHYPIVMAIKYSLL